MGLNSAILGHALSVQVSRGDFYKSAFVEADLAGIYPFILPCHPLSHMDFRLDSCWDCSHVGQRQMKRSSCKAEGKLMYPPMQIGLQYTPAKFVRSSLFQPLSPVTPACVWLCVWPFTGERAPTRGHMPEENGLSLQPSAIRLSSSAIAKINTLWEYHISKELLWKQG